MDLGLKDKVALVAGGSSGLGLAIGNGEFGWGMFVTRKRAGARP